MICIRFILWQQHISTLLIFAALTQPQELAHAQSHTHTNTHKPIFWTKILTHSLVTHFNRTHTGICKVTHMHSCLNKRSHTYTLIQTQTDSCKRRCKRRSSRVRTYSSCVYTHTHACIDTRCIHPHTDVHTETSKVKQTYPENDITYNYVKKHALHVSRTHSYAYAHVNTSAHTHT
jgi:hypothetical protein